MIFIYINTVEDRVVTVSKKRIDDLYAQEALDEYQVSDDFDMSKEFPSEENEGETVRMEGFLNATEFLERYNADYKARRTNSYPSVEDQQDMQYWDAINGTTTWKDAITTVKADNPKP